MKHFIMVCTHYDWVITKISTTIWIKQICFTQIVVDIFEHWIDSRKDIHMTHRTFSGWHNGYMIYGACLLMLFFIPFSYLQPLDRILVMLLRSWTLWEREDVCELDFYSHTLLMIYLLLSVIRKHLCNSSQTYNLFL